VPQECLLEHILKVDFFYLVLKFPVNVSANFMIWLGSADKIYLFFN
jgi:hypothetical protein